MIRYLAVIWLAFGAPPALAQVHSPDIEARLGFLIGDWTLEGQEGVYRETCDWFKNRSFVVCRSEDATTGSLSQSILGYSASRGRFTYHSYGASGESRSEFGHPHGERGIVYTDDRQASVGHVRLTTRLEPQADGRFRFIRERSVNGGPWETTADIFYIRRKP